MLYNITKSIGLFVGKQASIAVTSFKVGYELGLQEVEMNELHNGLKAVKDSVKDACDVPNEVKEPTPTVVSTVQEAYNQATGFENDPNADFESPYGHHDGVVTAK